MYTAQRICTNFFNAFSNSSQHSEFVFFISNILEKKSTNIDSNKFEYSNFFFDEYERILFANISEFSRKSDIRGNSSIIYIWQTTPAPDGTSVTHSYRRRRGPAWSVI